MKRVVVALTLLGFLFGVVGSTQAQDFGYGGGYTTYPAGYGYPVQPVGQQEQYPILKKVLIGGALIGAGFLAGRLTAPKQPQYNYYPPQGPQYLPGQFGGGHGHNHGHNQGSHYYRQAHR